MVRPILTVPHPGLKTPSQSVTIFNNDLLKLVEDMVETMRHAPGVGLAAPQIGVSKRVVVIEYDPKKDDSPRGPKVDLTILVNPEIKHYSKEQEVQIEGCLSIPKVEISIARSKKIKVIAQDVNGIKQKFNAVGFLARIVQHEVDHVNGILITDRAKNNSPRIKH